MPLLSIPERWDTTTDVVVVGGGNAGLPAAIAAADAGSKVIVLEAGVNSTSSLAKVTGGHCFAGTDIQKEMGIDDSPKKLFEDALDKTQGSSALWRIFAYNQLEVYKWIKHIVGKPVTVMLGSPHNETRVHRFKGVGPAWIKALKKEAGKRENIEMLFKHRAMRLFLDPKTARVIGVKAQCGTQEVDIKARKAVILTTGGFLQNKDFVQEFGPFATGCIPAAPITHRGDGLRMALDVGAATANIATAAAPSISICTTTKLTTQLWAQGPIMVTAEGKRWCNEAGPHRSYNVLFKNLLEISPDGLHFVIYDRKIREAATPDNYLKHKEYKANSIVELAGVLSLDAGALTDTINRYNRNIDEYGYDIVFGRKFWGGLAGKQPAPKIDTPPYYALRCQVSLTSAKGGLKINTRSQVIDLFGDVIPGLYAAGEIAGGFFSKPNVYLPGTFSVLGIVFGKIAGKNAALESSI
jgi:fumarate reductase flavoprotein subunit